MMANKVQAAVMKKLKKALGAVGITLAMLCISVSCQAATGPSEAGALHVEGTKLIDKNGTPIQLKGLSTHGIAWFPQYINEAAFKEFHEDWNANVIRLAMYTAESGGYCTDGDQENLKQLIRDGVRYAIEQDMYVIVDWHVLNDQNPLNNIEYAKTFFAEMTAEFGDTDYILYEICNEPNGGTSWEDIKVYAEEIIPIIRENDPDAIIIVGTPNWSQYVHQATSDPITDYENVMYALHYYAATHKEDLRQNMQDAVRMGLPIFVSEYGICDASGNGSIDVEQANLWIDAMDELGISYVCWNISNKNETSAIFRSDCTKVSGFTEADLSESGAWLYQMLNEGVPAENEETTEENVVENADVLEEERAETLVLGNEAIQIQAQVKNSWESEGKSFFQYDLTLKNITETDLKQWTIELEFNEEITLSDGWNGNYTVNGNVLTICNKEYNGEINMGHTVADIGFIVCSGAGLSLEGMEN